LIVVQHQMSHLSAISWREQITFNEITMLYALY